MIEIISAGLLLGVSAGFAPGPLLTLVISETLRHGIGSGIRVAIAPLITDIPIIALTFLLSAVLADASVIIGLISLAGASFVFWLGVSSLRMKQGSQEQPQEAPRSLSKGIVTNALSPHPYIFWLTVGTPILSKGIETDWKLSMAFIILFYVCLVSAKILLAVLTGRSRKFLLGKAYINTMRALGALMCLFALLLFKDGIVLMGIL